ncbi:MAG: HlyC/CorC family transporter [Candidatus Marinimicrobia bacterium]|nr:HlyC/CorC family transporter [Candidatus Neomarinimicrobiota bacterium]
MSRAMLDLLLILALLVTSALLSGAETAYFRIQSRLKDYGDDELLSPGVKAVLENPRRLLISLLTGNTFVNIAVASLAALITADLAREWSLNMELLLIAESIVISAVLLLFGEVMPKLLAMRHAPAYARFASRPVRILVWLLYPIGGLIYGLTHLLIRLLRIRPEKMFTSEEEMKDLAQVGSDRGTLDESEAEIIHSIFEFGDTSVDEIMTPRVDILALETRAGLAAASDLIRDSQVSKIPIYKDSIDDVRGILYAKDILPYLNGTFPEVDLLPLARPPFFVPDSKKVNELLQEFQQRRTSIAIVVDEFGGTAGLATLEDVVEEVLGELRDPYDLQETEVIRFGDDEFLVEGSMPLDDLESYLGGQFPSNRDYETIGGFLFDQFNHVPGAGQSVDFMARRFTVRSLEGNRITKVHIGKQMKETQG